MPKKLKPKTPKTEHSRLILHCRIVLLISRMKYPHLPSYIFPTYMLLKYVKLIKSKRTFRVKSVPQSLLINVLKNNPLIDMNNCVVVNEAYFRAILNSSEYVILRYGAKERLVQVLGGKISEDDVLTSDTLDYNLKLMGLPQQIKIAEVDLTQIKIADEIDLSLISAHQNVGNAVTDLLLKNYFRNPKLLYRNDIIAVSVEEYAPDYFYTNSKCNEIDYLHFKCNGITFGATTDCSGGYFCVIGATTLKQSADTQSLLPAQLKLVKEVYDASMSYEEALVDSCPSGLTKYLDRLEKGIRPFLSKRKMKLNPIFLLQGAKGSGKDLLLSSLSAKFGLKLCRLTSNDLSAHAYAQNEIKMRNAFFRCKLCAPCIVVINNFENLCKNNEGHHDPRIINSFKTELETLLTNNEHPIVLVCVSNQKELPSELSRIFLEAVNVDAPDQTERAQLLQWILLKKGLRKNPAVEEIAGKTHGFVYEDLEALLYYAKRNVIMKSSQTEQLQLQDFEAALDVMQSNYTESLGAPKVPKVEWSDVGGLDDVKHEIIKTINLPLKHPELLKSGLKRSGILLYGPPGTGKTLIAKAVATECGLCFLSVKGPELLNMYVGQSEQNVREVFEKARQASPCIIFFDELDSLAPNRGISGDSGGVMDRVVSQLLSEMDGLNENTTLFVIGATNRPDLIDPALLRPGRFDKLLYVGPCTDQQSKISVLKALTRNFNLSEKLSIERVVKICPENITGADFYGICSSAWMSAASRLIRKIEKGKAEKSEAISHVNVLVTFKDFEEAVKSTKPSISPEDLLYFDRLKRELSAKK